MAASIPRSSHLFCSRRRGKQHVSARLSCLATRVWDGTASSTIAHAVEMHFNLPYRTSFGQSLSIVGSTDDFGAWDISTRVPMEWSDGDVWKAKVVADAAAVEYKYVVVEQDGTVAYWKPGGNFEVKIEGFRGQVHIDDTWDGVHEVSTTDRDGAPGPRSVVEQQLEQTEAPAAVDYAAAAPELQPEEQQMQQEEEQMQSEEDVGLATTSGEYDDVLKAALQQTYGELKETLETSLELADGVDPDDPRLLMNDQKLAAVHRRATSLSRAISAGAPPPAYILREIEKNIGDGDSPSQG